GGGRRGGAHAARPTAPGGGRRRARGPAGQGARARARRTPARAAGATRAHRTRAPRPEGRGRPGILIAPMVASRARSRAVPVSLCAMLSNFRPDLRILTPLRGIAALWVVIYHFGDQYLPALRPEQAGHLVGKGYLAVDLFFMLSGFVLAHVYHADFTRFDPGRYRDFLAARVARLYPLHLLVLLAFVVTAIAGRLFEFVLTGQFERLPLDGAHSITALLANLLMLQGLAAGELSWNYPAWSISVEFFAYLLFPLAIGPTCGADGRRGAMIALALAAGVFGFAWFAR